MPRISHRPAANDASFPDRNWWHLWTLLCCVPRRVNDARKLGVKVGLGTDVAGGYSPSMLSALRTAVITSQAVRMQHLGPEEHGEGPSPANAHLLSYKVRLPAQPALLCSRRNRLQPSYANRLRKHPALCHTQNSSVA